MTFSRPRPRFSSTAFAASFTRRGTGSTSPPLRAETRTRRCARPFACPCRPILARPAHFPACTSRSALTARRRSGGNAGQAASCRERAPGRTRGTAPAAREWSAGASERPRATPRSSLRAQGRRRRSGSSPRETRAESRRAEPRPRPREGHPDRGSGRGPQHAQHRRQDREHAVDAGLAGQPDVRGRGVDGGRAEVAPRLAGAHPARGPHLRALDHRQHQPVARRVAAHLHPGARGEVVQLGCPVHRHPAQPRRAVQLQPAAHQQPLPDHDVGGGEPDDWPAAQPRPAAQPQQRQPGDGQQHQDDHDQPEEDVADGGRGGVPVGVHQPAVGCGRVVPDRQLRSGRHVQRPVQLDPCRCAPRRPRRGR